MGRRNFERDGLPKERVVGLSAARAVIEARPQDVLNIAHSRDVRREIAEILRFAAEHHIAYRELVREELDRLADTVHHEGICMLVRARPQTSIAEVSEDLALGGFVIALDNVDNPHNIGAVLRSAAFFGARALLVGSETDRQLTPSAVRVAEGGAEALPVVFTSELGRALLRLSERGAEIVGADAHAPQAGHALRFRDRTVLVLGSERHGLSPEVERVCDRFVRIDGTGRVESLNVSVAAGVLMAHLYADWERG